ncbi:polyprotein [Helicoverpa armigera iflavirus]|uniref:polyprotein n=1 Tax=Helicoverpa armigera iflavirus TaxID=1936269 RepID=UPI000973191A|nr:polyprotein [Helicoverpa armigera iflavirus]APW84897.1 polyprotein [Helicoverpa armigera iflavirus]
MSSFNVQLLQNIFSDLIAQEFDSEQQRLRVLYDKKYEHRANFGFDSALERDRLEDEWRFKYNGLVKRRNWLWFLMKNCKFVELDDYFNTDFTFSDVDLRLRVDYEFRVKKDLNRYKYINRKSNFVPFSVSNLDVEDLDLDNNDIDYLNLDANTNVVTYKKRRTRSYEALVDNNYVYNKCEIDNRDYNLLYFAAIRLRSVIELLSSLRNRLSVNKFYRRSKILKSNDIELQELRYEGGLKPEKIEVPKKVVRNMLKPNNRPLCCNYCPTITCLKCFRGEGCCDCDSQRNLNRLVNRLVYQGNVEQNAGGDTDVVQTDTAKNVVLTETEITQSDNTSLSNIGWSSLTSSDTITNHDNLVNRWLRVGTYEWDKSKVLNTTLVSLDLPRVAIFGGTSTCDQPNKIPFRVHRFWRGDMRVKIHINCNKFQIGQLQCSWYYQPKADASFPTKNNVYTRSGTHHCIISAAPNNEVELFIPYKAYKSMYHTKTPPAYDWHDLPLDLGTLFVTVLSPLKTTGETSPKCSFTVFVKLENNEFTGMIAGDIDTPRQVRETKQDGGIRYEMDAMGTVLNAAVPLVEKLLVHSGNDNNRDNPPVNAPPAYVVPTASHSWSYGTDVSEPLHNLRLSARAQTCHPDVDLDEMKIDVLKRKFMLCDIFQWSQQRNNGDLLWDLPVNPIPPKTRLHKTASASTGKLATYQLTPIGYLSSLYNYWRGSIEFRFDIVASQFHSGKLMLAYIPGIPEGESASIEQARASPNIVISLDNAMSYTWRVPYIADRPWWPRRYAGESVSNNTVSPSKIFVFVLNELVLAETVPDTLDVLVYMRGGEDMEFSIPVQPSIGLGYDRTYVASRDTTDVFMTSTTTSVYVGNWHTVPQCQVLRHAATSEAVARFTEPILDRPVYYVMNNSPPLANTNRSSGGPTLRQVTRFVFLKSPVFSEYISIPVWWLNASLAAQERLEAIARACFTNNFTVGDWMKDFVFTTTTADAQTSYGFFSKDIVTTSNTSGGIKTIPFIATTVSTIEYQGNREQSFAMVDNTQNLASTGRGMLTFGERFVDLKDLARRYQIYGWTSIPKENIERDPGACSFIVPILPQGLDLAVNTPTTVNQIWNRAREGHIPLIAGLYRFYRGSIRIRIIVTNGDGLVAWVQHRPDRKLARQTITPCTSVTTAEAVFNHTYGVYMQDLNVNRVIEVEVPFYQMANFGLLQQPVTNNSKDWGSFYSLGELSVGFFGNSPSSDVRCTVYYALGDDCRFTTYQGVPPVVLLDDLPEYNSNLQYEGWGNVFRSPKEVGGEVAEGVSEGMIASLQPVLENFLSDIKSALSDTYASVKDTISGLDFSSKLSNILSQIVHAINNPSPSTIAISVISILLTLGIVTYAMYNTIKEHIVTIWKYIMKKVSPSEQRDGVEVGAEASELIHNGCVEENAATGFMSIICGGLCTLFGMKNDREKYVPISDSLFKNIDKGMKMSNVCFVFFRNLMSVIGDMKTWIVQKLYPGFNAAEALLEGRDIIDKWITYSHELFDPMTSQNIKYSQDLQLKLLDCYAFGKILRVKAKETNYPAVIQLVNNTFDKLHKLHVELVAQGIDPQVRKMPFVIYNYGAPEIGKSHLTTDICTELCKSQDIKTETSLMCVLNATSKFWDNCDRQPCLVMDDAFNIRKGTMLEDQIAAIFNVVSPVVLIPPRAAVEDKGRPYNPEIFVLNSNVDFFKTEVCMEEALWRRRDILIKSELDPDFKKEGCPHCEQGLKVNASLPKEAIAYLKDYHHLKFKYTFDVTNPNCSYLPDSGYLKYSDLLVLLKNLFKKNREAEQYKFATRVEANNSVAGATKSIVSNVDNLEQLWNDAMNKRRMAQEIVRNSTMKTIMNSFNSKVKDNLAELKYQILKRVSVTLNPTNNKYLLLNPTCTECVRIKYQCMVCQIKLQETLKQSSVKVDNHVPPPPPCSGTSDLFPLGFENEAIPSTSSSSVSIIDDIKLEGDDVGECIPIKFLDGIVNEVNETTAKWFDDVIYNCTPEILNKFQDFIKVSEGAIILELRKYPKFARTVSVFKNICNSLCNCCHNYKNNPPFVSEGKCSFINPRRPDCPDNIVSFTCRECCYMTLPWMIYETAKYCKENLTIEPWMTGLVDCDYKGESMLSRVLSNMIKWVYDFYYNKMTPAVKAVYTFFSTFTGWVLGFSFISLIFSTIIMGAGCMDVCENLKQSRIITREMERVAKTDWDKMINAADQGMPFDALDYENKTYADSGKGKVNRHVKPKIRVPNKVSKELQHEGVQQFSVVEERLKENMASIVAYVTDSDGIVKKYSNYGIMLRGQTMLIQQHYYDFWKRLPATATFHFVNNKIKNHPLGLPLYNFFELEVEWFATPNVEYSDSNFGLLHLPNTLPSYKDITKFIAKSTDHEYVQVGEIYLYHCSEERMMHCNMHVVGRREVTDGTWLRLDECYSYQYSGVGLCGSVLVARNLERPIIGIHFAGLKSGNQGFAEPIVQESFVTNASDIQNYRFDNLDLHVTDDKPKVEFDTLLYPQGCVPREFAHNQGCVSQYVPSLIQGVYEVDTEPNPLSPRDPRVIPPGQSPLKLGCEHMGKPPIDFEPSLLEVAADDLCQTILKEVKPVRHKIELVSLQDAICGNSAIEGFHPLEWSSSEGFPLRALRPANKKGKKWLFDLEETSDGYKLNGMVAELKRQLCIGQEYRKQGIRIPTVFTDCLKDTCIDLEKCKIPGKTRIFSISPVQYTIAFKQYFNDFLASYQNCRINSEHGIGINVDSLEWTKVANYITTYGNKIVAGDYKNFGPGLMLACVKKCFDIIMAWYERYDPDPERNLVRRVLLSEILYARHLCLNVMYEVPCGIPSGSPITTPLNSLVNSLYIRCAWKVITGQPFDIMHSNIKILTYGDDVCINVSDEYIYSFNTITLSEFFKKYNIVFTDIDKSDNIVPYRTLDNVTFLKRGFVRHPHSGVIFLAPIDEQSIRKCVNWIHNKGDHVLNTLENCVQACELAFGHGPTYYNKVREELSRECMKKLHVSFKAPSWIEKSERCYDI